MKEDGEKNGIKTLQELQKIVEQLCPIVINNLVYHDYEVSIRDKAGYIRMRYETALNVAEVYSKLSEEDKHDLISIKKV